MGNKGGLPADDIPWQGFEYSLLLTLPPLGVVYLKPGPKSETPDVEQSVAPVASVP